LAITKSSDGFLENCQWTFFKTMLYLPRKGKASTKEFFMKCRSCGKYLFESDTHCPDCGVSIQRQPGETLLGIFFIIAGLLLLFLLVRKNF
jgi:hypothetical protein